MLTTRVPIHWRKHEFAELFVRGTGLNNHNASVFKIDDTVLLDDAFYRGLYLAVLDRRDLSLVESGFYDTSIVPGMRDSDKSITVNHGTFQTIDDFVTAREMA